MLAHLCSARSNDLKFYGKVRRVLLEVTIFLSRLPTVVNTVLLLFELVKTERMYCQWKECVRPQIPTRRQKISLLTSVASAVASNPKNCPRRRSLNTRHKIIEHEEPCTNSSSGWLIDLLKIYALMTLWDWWVLMRIKCMRNNRRHNHANFDFHTINHAIIKKNVVHFNVSHNFIMLLIVYSTLLLLKLHLALYLSGRCLTANIFCFTLTFLGK